MVPNDWSWVGAIERDVRDSLRQLARTPAFSVTAVLVLALGIGATSAVFGLVSLLLLQPPPGADRAGTVVSVHVQESARVGSYRGFTFNEFELRRDRAGVFSELAAHAPYDVSVSDRGETRRVQAAFASRSYFELFNGRVAIGRSFAPDEERPGSGAAVLVLSDSAWRRIGRPAEVLGRTLTINAERFTVVGVAPAGFSGAVRLAGPDFWMPFGAAALLSKRATDSLRIVGRLGPGVSVESANAALQALSASFQSVRPSGRGAQVLSVAVSTGLSQGIAPPANDTEEAIVGLVPMMAAALTVLLVASLNVANMQLLVSRRTREIGIRVALGAQPHDVTRMVVTEGAGVLLAGVAVGLALALAAGKGVSSLLVGVASFDPAVMAAATTALAAAVMAACYIPAWRATRVPPVTALRVE